MAEVVPLVVLVPVVAFFGYLLGLAVSVVAGEKWATWCAGVAALLGLLLDLPVVSMLTLGYLVGDILMRRFGGYHRDAAHG